MLLREGVERAAVLRELAGRERESTRRFGEAMVKAMPKVLSVITIVGTLAMLWVGGHLFLQGLYDLGWHVPLDLVHHLEDPVHGIAVVGPTLAWFVETLCSLLFGLVWGLVFVGIMALLPFGKHHDADPHEVAEARAGLRDEADRLRSEISASEEALTGLMRDSGDGAGDDQADTGTKNVTREHEMALATNAREVLRQTERAIGRLEAGTYGLCENCGNPIGKARMQAFPRATLCVDCKQKQERRF